MSYPIKYKVISALNLIDLVEKVNKAIFEGWELQGGVSFMPDNEPWAGSCHQAVIMRTDEEG